MGYITSDRGHLVSSVPHYTRTGYAVVMKTIANTLKFEESEPAKFRLMVLDHTKQFGWKSTSHAYHVSRATIFRWRKRMNGRFISLVPTSTRPHTTRRMIVDEHVLALLRTLRETYGNISKEKLKFLLDAYTTSLGIPSYGATKIGKIIRRYRLTTPTTKRVMKRRNLAVFRRKYAPRGVLCGHCEMDGITVYFCGATYRFVSIIDVVTRQGMCQLVPSLSSIHTSNTLTLFQKRCAFHIHTVQTDNGSEFLGTFHDALEAQGIRHEFTYPRCPRINGVVERFNRTLQEECINRIIDTIDDKAEFQKKLADYMIWYNEKRLHYALHYMTPKTYTEQLTGGQ